MHNGPSMPDRANKLARLALLLAGAFLFGGASAEVAVRTHQAVEQLKAEREIGAAGQLVALELTGAQGEVVARPRLIAPRGKAAELVLHDPAHPGEIRLTFRVEAERDPTGDIALDYELSVPSRAVTARGKISLTPGVEQSIQLGGGVLVATWLALPVPSAGFDAYLESEAAARRAAGRTS
ncbi:hypothetical protein Adeh_4237 [Anaeromyxobacter dehalogenans 2CP-C]|uniref:Uncharacterized protein n=2 Tax=Anaeromyxobacter dehalogenans TaxID=161493 RepID=Q2IHE6_ANADE|nr:hypothetical protein Adeh_4237 [Anaeromyxobacter dehalogenans 2CP-C]